ncbi:PIN domain-containing protein [Mesorhizobium sp. VK9D]|uniref:PIN domain-containing protein n=1 Tax=Mesorhizobium australafricanum TaxID=3072311 RepID=UPI002A244EBA|nr:PIN domain-containing protein [Mesorhizobium sp. VK9D]MDX8452621.1 PIN domain-containing protein [Mesorhizobium sp. VK9D]
MKVALDTNILVYAEGVDSAEKRDTVLELLSNVPQAAAIVPIQVLGELYNVLVRKAGRSREVARDTLLGWQDAFPVAGTTPEVMLMAADLAADHHFGIWDAVILSMASQTGCRLLLSENLQDGFTWGGVTVVNPFASPRHALLDAFLGAD